VDFSEARDLFGNIFQFRGPNCKIRECGLILRKLRGQSAKCQKLEFPGIVFLKENPWTKSTSSWTAPGWPVHGSTVDSTVADGRGSSKLSLAAAPGHGGLPRGWRREGRDATRPGDRSPELGRWRGGSAPAMKLQLQAATVCDEDITPMDTNNTPQVDIQGPITHARTRQLNLQVTSFLRNYFCAFESSILPNDLTILRNEGEDQQGCGKDLGGVEDQ
jgi:hypothetical protein